jgi:hypothetical protein
MVLKTHLFLLKCLLLPKFKAKNHTTLSPPKAAFSKSNCLPHFSLQCSSTFQQMFLAFKAYLQKLISDNLGDSFCFIVIHSFRSYNPR